MSQQDLPNGAAGAGRRDVLLVVLVAILVRLVPAFLVHGTEDVWAWRYAVEVSEAGGDPYLQQHLFNWPPVWLHAVTPLVVLARAAGLPYHGLVKLYPVLADALIAALVVLVLRRTTGGSRTARWGGLFYALNPVSIGITAIHGNYIAVPTALLFLSTYLLHFGRARWAPTASAFACGLAIMTKTWPVLFLPLLLARVPSWKGRTLYAATAAVFPALLLLSLWARPEGGTVVARCLGYQSYPGWWGFTGLWRVWDTGWLRGVAVFYAAHGTKVLGCMLVAVWFLRVRQMELFAGFVTVALTMLVFAPGFGPQYLLWALPFAIVARDRWVYTFTAIVAALFVVEYGFRPFTGQVGLAVGPDPFPPLTLEERLRDNSLTNLLRLPVWAFVSAWLGKTLWSRPPEL